jgi:hypothetical protein
VRRRGTCCGARRHPAAGFGSFGGIQTLLTAEKGLGIRAFVAFAPAAQSWNPVLAERLKQGVRQAQAPILIIQAQNDYSVEPCEVLPGDYVKARQRIYHTSQQASYIDLPVAL